MRGLAARLACAPGLPIFLATLAVYCALVPWQARVWARGGDEPHYLLAAHSLVFDHDLDLSNNYAQHDYARFYGEAYLNPHVRLGPRGQAVLTHNLGLSLLIAPAYALGGLRGVLYFLAGLGALLAANAFLLGYELTRHWVAALVGWAAVSFTPPVLWYVFLVYPEMLAGLILVVALRALFTAPGHDLGRARALVLGLALAWLPWLSSRFLPVYALFIGLALWRAWAARSRPWLTAALLATSGLIAYMLFSYGLYGSASPAASYAGPIPLAIEGSYSLTRLARGLAGWLLDNQRGLLVAAPIYVVAFWGVALLIRRRRAAGLGLLLPFVLALVPIAAWGGFWTGWEYSARFLVAALPPLGAGVAYLWAAGRRSVVRPITLALLVPSLLTAAVVIDAPLRGLISSPVELLKPRLNLEAVVPAMARFAFLPPGPVGAAAGGPLASALTASPSFEEARQALTWQVPRGEAGPVLRQVDLPEFPFGWYTGRLPLAAPGAPADVPVARIRIFSPSGGEYFARTIYGRDIPAAGPYTFHFQSPVYNGWAYPPTVMVSATGQADLQLGLLSLEPDGWHSLGLAAAWLAVLALLGVVLVRAASQPRPLAFPGSLALNGVLAIAALASLGWSLLPQARVLSLVELQRSTGAVVADARAYKGRAIQASPEAGDEAGKLALSQPELYAPGRYRLSLSVAGAPSGAGVPGEGASTALTLRAASADGGSLAQRWDIPAPDLPLDGRYRSLSFEFDNPRQQALTFSLDYAGTAPVRADRLTIQPLP